MTEWPADPLFGQTENDMPKTKEELANELQALIQQHPKVEPQFQKFFTDNPQAFMMSPATAIYDKHWARGAHLPGGIEPDFILTAFAAGQIIELEIPEISRPFSKVYPIGRLRIGIRQIAAYLSIFESRLKSFQEFPEFKDCTHWSGRLFCGVRNAMTPNARRLFDETQRFWARRHVDLLAFDQVVDQLRKAHRNESGYTGGLAVTTRHE